LSTALVVAGLCLLVLPGLRVLPSERLDPSEWARAAAFSLRTGHVVVRAGLLFGAAPTVLRTLGVEHVADACHRMFGPVAPGGPVVGWASGFAFVLLTGRARQARTRQRAGYRSTMVESWVGLHERAGGVDLVTLPLTEPVAFAVPLGAGQIVISQGLVDALEPAELDAVVAHEASHLRHRHDRHLIAAAVAQHAYGWLAPVAASAATVQLAVERWADEDAAGTPERRPVVRDALAKTTATLLGPALAFASTCTVLQRLDALDDGPPAPTVGTRFAALAPLVAAAVVTAVLVGLWSTYTHHGLLGIIGFCPD
jgi:Zn-dependent protease with chaperone function